MTVMHGDPVREALEECLQVLAPHARDRDWTVPAGPLEWSCRDTAAHIAHDLLAYAGQLAARPRDRYLPFDLTVRPEADPQQVLAVLTAAGPGRHGRARARGRDRGPGPGHGPGPVRRGQR
ncbi:GNAT family N-acetyltransferase, partial [Streptomyces sp. NPDC048209]